MARFSKRDIRSLIYIVTVVCDMTPYPSEKVYLNDLRKEPEVLFEEMEAVEKEKNGRWFK